MQVVVPFAAETPKTRLRSVLSAAERSRFARAMLADVLEALARTGHDLTVVATSPLSSDDDLVGVPSTVRVEVDDRPLTDAVDARLPRRGRTGEPVAVVMADLALATPESLEGLFGPDADVVIAPGRGGGTNALVVRHPDFRADYHGASYLDHRAAANGVGASLETIDSFRLGTDIDEPADLVEVLIHGTGRSPECLRALGFELERTDGRVDTERSLDSTSADSRSR
ncbi:2-phospho-L-lactate guanylyltransferase [Natrarchaeobius halalkaliphilus]|uniref:2-phospho-L-lactate guanylyltransferase n=1 Tax=Natrarchaeobius halalkaliphilus TaxID=1679091 RepID=A0A3N6LQ22_9EURY|nr:2-phospho-L-lactate guanylyltransferase [Natrarchaeobius halalkaliphilus]RQG91653.1 2-phospho-L-lactate guanylyltransferase [Natrarchaeobius halalkaliphilus]